MCVEIFSCAGFPTLRHFSGPILRMFIGTLAAALIMLIDHAGLLAGELFPTASDCFDIELVNRC